MITKERLEELIQKKATIWVGNKYWYAYSVDLDINYIGIADGKDSLFTLDYSINDKGETVLIDYLEYLFETKEDAEEYVEFGNITRTERLDLPSWEDVKDKGYDEIFFVKDNRFDSGVVQYYFLVAEQTKEIQIMFREIDHLMIITAYDVIFNKSLTRKNYNEARRLCVKLFKGE